MNKHGFTMVEIVCVIAIIVTLLAVTTIGITDHLNRTKMAANRVIVSRRQLDSIDIEVFDDEKPSGHTFVTSSSTTTTKTGNSSGFSGSEVASVISGSVQTVELPEVITPDPAKVTLPELTASQTAIRDYNPERFDSIYNYFDNYTTKHNVELLEGAEDVVLVLATAEAAAAKVYEEGNYNTPRYIKYYPASGVTQVATSMTSSVGQNYIKGYLVDSAAEKTEGTNVRGQLNGSFLNNSNNCIYIGVNRDTNGDLQIVPCVCIDTNGNYNTVITHTFSNKIDSPNRSTYNAETGGSKGWNSYVMYVTNAAGDILDTSVLDTSRYTREENVTRAKEFNTEWKAAMQELRISY